MDGMNRALLYQEKVLEQEEVIRLIIAECAEEFNTSIERMCSSERKRWECVYPRQCAMHLIRTKYPKLTLVKVGSYFKGYRTRKSKNHATVLHAYKSVKELLNEKWGCKDFISKHNNVNKRLFDYYGITIK